MTIYIKCNKISYCIIAACFAVAVTWIKDLHALETPKKYTLSPVVTYNEQFDVPALFFESLFKPNRRLKLTCKNEEDTRIFNVNDSTSALQDVDIQIYRDQEALASVNLTRYAINRIALADDMTQQATRISFGKNDCEFGSGTIERKEMKNDIDRVNKAKVSSALNQANESLNPWVIYYPFN